MIKLINKDARFELVSEFDEAFDQTANDVKAEGSTDTRFDKYLSTLDASTLARKAPDAQPSSFLFRPLTGTEQAQIQSKHFAFDSETKSVKMKNVTDYFIDLFNTTCLGTKREDGSWLPVTAADINYNHVYSMASSLMILQSLGKHLKNA